MISPSSITSFTFNEDDKADGVKAETVSWVDDKRCFSSKPSSKVHVPNWAFSGNLYSYSKLFSTAFDKGISLSMT